jgi:phosphoglycerate dehydrogenase-like enzyme
VTKGLEGEKALVWLAGMPGVPSLEPAGFARLRDGAPEFFWDAVAGEADFLERLPGARLVLTWRFRREWLGLAPGLRLISTPAAGREWVEARSRPPLRVWFGGFHGVFMAETVAGLMLAFARGIKASLDCQARGESWPRERVTALMRPLRGGRAVILGFGHIGKWIGRLVKPFGVRLAGVTRKDRSRPEYFTDGDGVYPPEELDSLLPAADHLILALPGDTGSDLILDSRRLALLPPAAFVYNVGRGNAIDEEALADRLRRGLLAGAGLDVFAREPLPPGAAILGAPNVIALPHVSAFAPGYLDAYLDEFLGRLAGEEFRD